MKRFLSVILISALSRLLYCPTVPAQEWTLDSCIRYACDNNLKILQEELNTQQSQNAVKKDEMNFIPSFNANMSHNMNWGRSVDLKTLEIITNQLSQNTSASIGASVYLLDGLSKLNTLKRDKIDLERSITDVENLKNEISISIAKAYLQILLSRQILEKCHQGLESIVTQAERTDKLVEAGSQPYSSLLEIKAQVASEQVNIVTADNNLKTNTLALMQMLDLQYSPEFSVFAPSDSAIGEMIESYQLNSVESLYADALSIVSNRMDQIPSKDSMPGSLYSDLAKIYEKAVQLPDGGSITIIAVTTLNDGDITHAIPDNTGYITEGQLFLRADSDSGKVIVDPFRSLSRLKQLVQGKKTREDHSQVMNAGVRLYADAQNAKTKLENGFDLSDYDLRCLDYAKDYATNLLSIDVNITIDEMLQTAWKLFAKYFSKAETGIKQALVDKYWPE